MTRYGILVWLVAAALTAIALAAGCRSSKPTGSAPSGAERSADRSLPAGQSSTADALIDADTEQAQAALHDAHNLRRPVIPDERSGTGVVDQPRVTGRR